MLWQRSYLTLNFPDTPAHAEDFNPERKLNKGYEDRKLFLSGSNMITTSDYIMLPLAQNGHLLPPGVSITVRLQRAMDSVVLCSPSAIGKNYRIEIDSCVMEVERCRVVDPLLSRIHYKWDTTGNLS